MVSAAGDGPVDRYSPRGPGPEAPIRYTAVARCLGALTGHAADLNATVPHASHRLRPGRWDRIERLISIAISSPTASLSSV